MMFSLNGCIALVTGAARGIGRAIVNTLAKNGAVVIAVDIDSSVFKGFAAEQQAGLQITAAHPDVASPDNWTTVVLDIERTHGKLDVLVNNAGIMEMRSFLETSIDTFRHMMKVHVESVFLGAKAS